MGHAQASAQSFPGSSGIPGSCFYTKTVCSPIPWRVTGRLLGHSLGPVSGLVTPRASTLSRGLGVVGASAMSEEGLCAGFSAEAALDSEGQELNRPVYGQGFSGHRKCPVPYPWLYLQVTLYSPKYA